MQCSTGLILFLLETLESMVKRPAFYFTIMLRLTISQVGWPSLQIATVMSDSKSSNTGLLEFMIFSNNECARMCNLSNISLQIVFDIWWASIHVASKSPIAWNNSTHAPVWVYYSLCGIEKTGSTGIVGIICHQVLRHPSHNGTSLLHKHFLGKSHIITLHKSVESEVTEINSSTVDLAAMDILRKQGSWIITTVSLQIKIIFHI